MDYEKAYNEAIKRAKAIIEVAEKEEEVYKSAITIFPELREGKEERTINCIGMCLTDANEQRFKDYGTTLKDCLAWLEKQGEQNPYGQRKECLDCQFNYAGECKGSCAMKRSEQKTQRMVSAEAKEALYDKPDAWSEKDESIALGIEQLCNCASLLNIAPDKIDKIRTWLKSLKDRYTWKPNSEQIECLHDAINHYHTNGYPASKLNELYEQMSKIYKL